MIIDTLPEPRFGDAVALWQEAGLTGPWNDPAADLRRAMAGAGSTVLAAIDDDGGLGGTLMVRRSHRFAVAFYAALGYEDEEVVVLGRVL